jgi:hypothetical protein
MCLTGKLPIHPAQPAPSPSPSRSNTYAVCNTLAGHYNSFGTKAPLPKKRLERLTRVGGQTGGQHRVGPAPHGCASRLHATGDQPPYLNQQTHTPLSFTRQELDDASKLLERGR